MGFINIMYYCLWVRKCQQTHPIICMFVGLLPSTVDELLMEDFYGSLVYVVSSQHWSLCSKTS